MTQTDRPLLTRPQVEAARIALVKSGASTLALTKNGGEVLDYRDLLDTLIAAFAQLAAVDDFAAASDATDDPVFEEWARYGYGEGYNDGRDALRRELRALRGIEA